MDTTKKDRRSARAALALIGLGLVARPSRAETRSVGPGKTYAAPCAAIAAARDGDVIEIDASGTYGGDVCNVAQNGLTLRGVGGRAKIDAAGKNAGGKGIWVISGNDTTVENIELSGATVPDKNGAGIRQEGNNLTVRGCYFHDNENGILSGGDAASQIVVESSEFANNGFGDGYSHNMYIGHEGKFTLRYSYSHDSKTGHLVKSRAAENHILYNRLTGERGTSSYEIDLPNGGTSYVIGNVIEQGPSTDNAAIVAYGLEGTSPQNPGHELFLVNNTVVNGRTAGATFVSVGGMMAPAVIENNVFAGGGTITNQAGAMLAANFATGDPMFVAPASYDFHLKAGSPCVDLGIDPGVGAGVMLAPLMQYVHPTRGEERRSVGALDVGAFELGGGVDAGTDGSSGGGGGGGGARDAGGPGGSAGNGGAGGSGDSAGSGGAGGSAGEAGRGGAAGGASGGASSDANDGGGCGCRVASSGHASSFAAWLACGALARRRRSRHGGRRARG